jgi:hypothetical protein
MSERAFALKDAYAENFAGGSMCYGPTGETVDFQQLLDEGGGVIRTDDEIIINGLSANEAFKSVSLSSAADAPLTTSADDGSPTLVEAINPDEYTKDDLLQIAEDEGVEVHESDKKADIAEAISAARREGENR